MENLYNGFTLELPPEAFPLSTDSMVLAYFAKLPKQARVLDLGSGCGTLGLLLCAKDPNCHVTGIEIDPVSHAGAEENIRRNAVGGRMESICADLRQVSGLFPAGSFTCCISNPPYFSGGPASENHTCARREDTCSLADLIASAAWALKYGGDFYLVHRPERAAEIIALSSGRKLEAKRLCLVRHRANGPVNLVLFQFRKGGNPGLKWEEIVLHTDSGELTAQYREIYGSSD